MTSMYGLGSGLYDDSEALAVHIESFDEVQEVQEFFNFVLTGLELGLVSAGTLFLLVLGTSLLINILDINM